MEPKHTPGPWAANGDSIMHNDAMLARVFKSTGIPSRLPGARVVVVDLPAEANARLIAAAPELLDALDRLWNVAGGWDHDDPDSLEAALDQALAALHQARGR